MSIFKSASCTSSSKTGPQVKWSNFILLSDRGDPIKRASYRRDLGLKVVHLSPKNDPFTQIRIQTTILGPLESQKSTIGRSDHFCRRWQLGDFKNRLKCQKWLILAYFAEFRGMSASAEDSDQLIWWCCVPIHIVVYSIFRIYNVDISWSVDFGVLKS